MIPPHISDTEEMRKLRAELQKQEKEILRRGVLLRDFLLEIKQLKKEKEWMINHIIRNFTTSMCPTEESKRKQLISEMQQALKEKVRKYDSKGAPIG